MRFSPLLPTLAILVGLSLTAPALAESGAVNEIGGLALKGYDPVAYFTQGKAVPGEPAITATHGGVTYRFASNADRDLFTADPAKYLPEYGGYCAFGAAEGQKADIDPQTWKIVNGKLYLNYNRKIQKDWLADVPGYITKADQKWPTVQTQTKVYR